MIGFEEYRSLLEADRSVRRFDSSRSIEKERLLELVELTRFCASGRNLQPLRYRVVSDSEECDALFPALAWAGYYSNWDGPEPSERPVAYLVQCLDTTLTDNPMCDDGLNLQAITLGARTLGIACCIIKAFNKKMLTEALSLPDNMEPRYVLALGYPAERVRIVELLPGGDYRYFRDSDDTQCVPKRTVEELLIG